MRCPSCGFENPGDARFCNACAVPLSIRCTRCGKENPAGARFCNACAGTLTQPAVSPGPSAPGGAARAPASASDQARPGPGAAELPEGERKTVTALFADVKGSTELMEEIDPEEARAIIDPALALMIDAVRGYDGYIVASTGDGIFALFGAPVAREDHPQAAIHAALRMQDDLRCYAERMRREGRRPIAVRVGLHTGEVVVRSIRTRESHAEYTPIGHTTNLAARMQTVAPEGSIAVTEATRRLCEGYFEFRPLGPVQVKGVSGPVNVYQVTGRGPLRTRLQVAERRGLTKFVGRERELGELRRVLELARRGRGQVVAVVAEPGSGKSRLCREFKALAPADCKLLEASSVSHGKGSAYLPVLELLRGYFGIEGADDKARRREKTSGALAALDPALDQAAPCLFSLLGLVEGHDPFSQLSLELRRGRILEAVKAVILRESLNQSVLVIYFEDLHWIDDETQALLNLLVDSIANARILLLVNYRPEYHHQWSNKSYYTQLRLDPLEEHSADRMLSGLLGSASAAPAGALAAPPRPRRPSGQDKDAGLSALKRLVIAKTEGNPFFIEEVVQMLFEDSTLVRNGAVRLTKPLAGLKIPATVQAILASRVDRLPPHHKELLQTLAVIGRQFETTLVKQLGGLPEDRLERALAELQLGEFIYEQPAVSGRGYVFKHALTQEVAYGSLLIERRRLLHDRIGTAIEALFAEHLEDHLGELAHHFSHSANDYKAVEYLRRAGEQSAARSACSEALAMLNAGLERLAGLPQGDQRARAELALQLALRPVLAVTKGSVALEVQRVAARALELGRQLGDVPQTFQALLALSNFHHSRAELRRAR